MHLNARERLTHSPHLRDINQWPDIPLDQIDKTKRRVFIKNRRSMAMALRGFRYTDIQDKTGISPSSISTLLERALSGEADEEPPLTQALIPWEHLKKSRRRKALPSLAAPAGTRCALTYLLDTVDELENKLDIVLDGYLKDDPHAENIRPGAFHEYFLQLLAEAGHPKDHYPHTQADLGYEALRQYMHQRLDQKRMERLIKQQPKRVIDPSQSRFAFGRELQFDEQTYDAQSVVYLKFDNQLVPLRMARFSLILVSDVDTDCRLESYLSFTQHPSQYDIQNALESAFTPEPLPELTTPGLSYNFEQGFPKNLDARFTRIAFSFTNVDNAMAHHASHFKSFWHRRQFGVFHAGIPRAPKPRNLIEHAIKLLSMQAKRLKSTSGKNVVDPDRESRKNQKKVPVVTVQEIEEMIRVLLVKHNNTPQPRLNGATPLETCQYHMSHQLLRLVPAEMIAAYRPYEVRQQVTVKWLKEDNALPHINFCYLRYRGKAINDAERVGKKVEIRYDYRDIRTLQVYDLYGKRLGEIYAPKTWRRYAHSVKTRSYIHRYCRRARIRMKDPLVEFFWLQVNRKNSQKSALEVMRLYREYHATLPGSTPINDPPADEADTVHPESDFTYQSQVPAWSTETANAQQNR